MPERPDRAAVEATFAREIREQDALTGENSEVKDLTAIEGNLQAIRQLYEQQEGEDPEQVEAERTALNAAIDATAEAHEGVTPTLIRMWIHGEDISQSLGELDELGADSYSEILASPQGTEIVQRIARQLEIDIGNTGDDEDGVDGNYGTLTREAVEQIQDALIQAGLLPENMENGNSNKDGLFGRRTLAALREAVSTEEAEAVVAAVEDNAPPEAFAAIREGHEDDAEVNAEDLDRYGAMFADAVDGVTYDPETDTFTEVFSQQTIPLGSVVEGNYGDVDWNQSITALRDAATEHMTTYFRSEGVENAVVDGRAVFQKDDRTISSEFIFSQDNPGDAFRSWLAGDLEEPVTPEAVPHLGLPLDQLPTLLDRVSRTAGVAAVGNADDGYQVQLFDGTRLNLTDVYAGVGELNDTTPLPNLTTPIQEAGERFAERHNLDFTPEVTDPGFQPAHFERDGQTVFQLSELTRGTLDTTILSAGLHPEREAIFREALDALRTD